MDHRIVILGPVHFHYVRFECLSDVFRERLVPTVVVRYTHLTPFFWNQREIGVSIFLHNVLRLLQEHTLEPKMEPLVGHLRIRL